MRAISKAVGALAAGFVAVTGCGGSNDDTAQISPVGVPAAGAGAGGSSSGAGGATAGTAGTGGVAAGAGGTAGKGGSAPGGAGQSGQGGQATAGEGGAGAGGAAAGMAGTGGGTTTLSAPQLVHGVAYVDTKLFSSIPFVIAVEGTSPDAITVSVDSGTAVSAASDKPGRFLATLDTSALSAGAHTLNVTATTAGATVATLAGSLTAAGGGMEFTQFSMVGPGLTGRDWYDAKNDRLGLTWVDVRTGMHQSYLAWLDGAFQRLSPTDVVLNDPADEALSADTAVSAAGDAIGVVYRVPGAMGGHWFIKMRVVGSDGTEKAKAMDLTAGEAAFTPLAAAADPGGFSGAWLHITDGTSPVQVRWARYDVAKSALSPAVTLYTEKPQPAGATGGPLMLDPQADLHAACNTTICVVTYTSDEWNPFVTLNVPKLHIAVIDIATNTLTSTTAVSTGDWDSQSSGVASGHDLLALADGTFQLVYTANDTAAAVTSKSPCDDSEPRNEFFQVTLDASGTMKGVPKAFLDDEGMREYPRIAVHPSGYAMLWEDQRGYCGNDMFIRMSPNVVPSDLSMLLDPYVVDPGSVGTPPSYPFVTVVGTNSVHGWSDNRITDSVLMAEDEIYLDTYWSK